MYKGRVDQSDVNEVAKYFQKKTDGAYSIKFGVNTVDIYMYMYYHTRNAEDPIQQMNLDISMTSYDNKIRVNVTEITDLEYTFLHFTVPVKETDSMEDVRIKILERIAKGIEREYEDYDVVF